jgi:hypothetical protein
VAKEAAITEAGAAVRTIEFVGVQNLIPTFCAFDTAIDQLEHQMFPSLNVSFLGFRKAFTGL